MGEVRAKILIENQEDRVLYRKGYLQGAQVRKLEVDALVDTGAVMILLLRRTLTPRPESPFLPSLKLK